jgi:hypothetical protein
MVQSMVASFLTPPKSFCGSLCLLPNYLLDLADLFLNFAGSAFHVVLGFQVRIHDNFPGDLLDLTLDLMHLAFCVVLCA